MKMLFMSLGVLVVMLIVVLIVLVTGEDRQPVSEVAEHTRFVQGVTVGGVNVSGLTLEQAKENQQLISKAQEAYQSLSYTFTVQGREYTYTAQQMGIAGSPEGVLEQAIKWGNIGDAETRDQQRQMALENGKDFPAIYADREAVRAALQAYKTEYDIMPEDATLKLADTFTPGQNVDFVNEVKGVDVHIGELARIISENINKGDNSVVEAPAIITDPKITDEELRANTVMICSWYSEFKDKSLSNSNRVTNIKILAGLINGSVIEPGEIWSINDTAGPRNAQTAKEFGWKEAPGIERGRYSEQYGGGVCQVSSTVYNAAIRAELDIAERKAHSWPSSYIKEGLDATISTGGPDLKLFNQYDYPVMLAAYVDEDKKSITVEIYGPALKHGYTVDFTHQKVQETQPAPPIYHYNAEKNPAGETIEPGKMDKWIEEKKGQVWKVFKIYLDSSGNRVGTPIEFSKTTYPAFQGEYYCNYPHPSQATPPPDPTTTQ
jgi:vancomycin resistance protein YoaR